MKRLVIGLLVWGAASSVGAEYRKTPGTRYDITELAKEFKAAGVSMQGVGCADEAGTVLCQKMSGDFTDAEKATMDAALAAHDPDARAKRKAKQQTDRAQAKAALKADQPLSDDQIKALFNE